MEAPKTLIPDVVYSYLFFICAVAFTLIMVTLAIIGLQCLWYNIALRLARFFEARSAESGIHKK